MGLRGLHLGVVPDSLKTTISLLKAGIEPVLVNTHGTKAFEFLEVGPERVGVAFNLYASWGAPLARYVRYGFALAPPFASAASRMTRLRDTLTALADRVGRVDLIFAHWGTGITPEIVLLKRSAAFRDVPVVLNFEAFPTGWQPGWRERFEFQLLRRAAPYVDATLVQTPEMAAAIERAAPELLDRPHRIEPFYLPAAFQEGDDEPAIPADDDHDVVFSGWLEFSRALNDVRPQLLALADAGLTVHCSTAERMDHPNVRHFEHFGAEAYATGLLAAFMRRFKASLVTYNVGASGTRALRFETSIPTRFLFTLAAGVPVLLPAGRFPPLERIVEEYGIGFAYETPGGAYRRLRSADWPELQRRAWAARRRFLFDAEAFTRFVRGALSL
jgi:hypothetical protein